MIKKTDSNCNSWHDNALRSAKGGVKVGELSILTCLLKDKEDSDTIEQKSRIVQKHGGQTSMILSLSSIQSNRKLSLGWIQRYILWKALMYEWERAAIRWIISKGVMFSCVPANGTWGCFSDPNKTHKIGVWCDKQNKDGYGCCNWMVANLTQFLSWRQIEGAGKGGD